MIRVLVCDLGKVLLPFDVERCWERIVPACDRGEAARAAFSAVYRECCFGTGGADARSFYERAAKAMGLRLDFETFCVAWSDMFWEDEAVIELVRRARVDERVLLSNTNEIHWEFIRDRYPQILNLFDRLVVSHECRFEKPDPAIYRFVESATGRAAPEHAFIDDILENVEAARALGWQGIHHTDAGRLHGALTALALL